MYRANREIIESRMKFKKVHLYENSINMKNCGVAVYKKTKLT